jgi:alpha-1,3-glucan synthase
MTISHSPAVPSPEVYQRARSTSTVHGVPRHMRSASHEPRRPQTAVPSLPVLGDNFRTSRIPVRPRTASPSVGEPTRPGRTLSRPGRSIGRSISSAFRSSSQLDLGQTLTLDRARSPLGGLVYSGDDVPCSAESSASNSPYLIPVGGTESWKNHRRQSSSRTSITLPDPATPPPPFPPHWPGFSPNEPDEESISDSPYLNDDLLLPPANFYQRDNISTLSLEEVVGDKNNFSLQKVDPSFTDSTEEYFNAFKTKLGKLNASNSEYELCIEEYLVKSEKAWFTKFRAAKLGRSSDNPLAPSIFSLSRPSTPRFKPDAAKPMFGAMSSDEFHLSNSYKPPRGFRKYLQYRIGDWPLYTIFLALGQIMGANSYQITLLSGPRGQNEEKFYIVSGIYLAASVFWWVCYRTLKSVHLLSIPFLLYGISLLLLATSPFFPAAGLALPRLQNTATALYTIASASGSLYFALNFGDEGGSPAKSWVFRACVIQGTQQVYICALWLWGSRLSHSSVTNPIDKTIIPVLFTASAVLFLISGILYTGLPSYYRQTPGKLPSLYTSLFRRKIVIWFFLTVLIQNFFLSTLTSRNWTYLWSSSHTKIYQIALLAVFFLIILWAVFLWCFGLLAKTHTWILPIFAIGLGAPRWVQILWSCTPIGSYLPWAGSPLASAMLGRALWLWLGLLDALQGVGFGMILLQTLTRIHISATLIGAQVLGASVTMLARAVGSDRLGPSTVFPDFSRGVRELGHPWFWVGLGCQMVVCAGFFKFFRKEQLSKP